MDIKSKRWYEKMMAAVKELMETLVMQEAEIVGYVNLRVEGHKISVGWNSEVLTVSSDPYKWSMPIQWFLSEDEINLMTSSLTEITERVRARVDAPRIIMGPTPAPPAPAHDEPDDAYPTIGSEPEDDDESMLGGIDQTHRVRSAGEIAGDLAD